MRRTVRLVGLLLFVGCGRKPPPAAPALAKPCASNEACEVGWVCLDGRCADTRGAAVYTRPEQAVTPEKVKRELERMQQQHERSVDETLEKATR